MKYFFGKSGQLRESYIYISSNNYLNLKFGLFFLSSPLANLLLGSAIHTHTHTHTHKSVKIFKNQAVCCCSNLSSFSSRLSCRLMVAL